MTSEPTYITVPEVCSLLQVSISTFNQRVSKRPGFPKPAPWKKRSRIYDRDDILMWMQRRK